MKYVFISYVHEDELIVNSLKDFLKGQGVSLWIDKENLIGGQNWKAEIRKAIKEGSFFLAFFSNNYLGREKTYMNEELAVAIEELRLRPFNTAWFIPVKLDACSIPEIPIGMSQTLSDIHCIDVSAEDGISNLWRALVPTLSPQKYSQHLLRIHLDCHIKSKIEHFKKIGAPRFKEIEDKWLSLLRQETFELIHAAFCELKERTKQTKKHEYENICEVKAGGRTILLSVTPDQNIPEFLKSLPVVGKDSDHPYIQFIIDQRRNCRIYPTWEERDLVHILYFEENGETLFDILYLLSFDLEVAITSCLLKKTTNHSERVAIVFENMYPTCILSAHKASEIAQIVYKEESGLHSNRKYA